MTGRSEGVGLVCVMSVCVCACARMYVAYFAVQLVYDLVSQKDMAGCGRERAEAGAS